MVARKISDIKFDTGKSINTYFKAKNSPRNTHIFNKKYLSIDFL